MDPETAILLSFFAIACLVSPMELEGYFQVIREDLQPIIIILGCILHHKIIMTRPGNHWQDGTGSRSCISLNGPGKSLASQPSQYRA